MSTLKESLDELDAALDRVLKERQDLLAALKALVKHLMPAGYWDHVAEVARPVVKQALIVIGRAEGKSVFGNDWQDVLP